MRGMLFVVLSFVATIMCWGFYGPTLHEGQEQMSLVPGEFARLRPFVCVGLAYFLIGVLIPAVLLWTKGEKGDWTASGFVTSFLAGTLGALGALGIVMAFTFGGKAVYVMPLVFGGAPVVNSFLTVYMAGKVKEIGPLFTAGLVMVLLGSMTVLLTAPKKGPVVEAQTEVEQETIADEAVAEVKEAGIGARNMFLQVLSLTTTILCWGAYGVTLHKGQAAMHNSRLRPLLCVGLAYFAVAVVVPYVLMGFGMQEQSTYNFSGTSWSLAAGAAGALGALGIIMAFNFGGKPIYVMPLVFGGAPVVNTLVSSWLKDAFSNVEPFRMAMFMAGLMVTIAGAVMVLVFAPKGPRHAAPAPADEVDPAPEPEPEPELEGKEADGAPNPENPFKTAHK